MDALKAHVEDSLGIQAQAMALLAVLNQDSLTSADLLLLKTVATKWYDSLRVQGETAYIEAEPGQPHAAGLGVNALVLRVFIAAPSLKLTKDPLVEKLANYVAGPALRSGQDHMWYSFAAQDSVFVMLGLAMYDRVEGSGQPHLTVTARTAGGKSLLVADFESGGAMPVSAVATYAGIGDPSAPPQILFRATGTGQASLSLGIHFIPAVTFSQPVFFGLLVEKSVAIINGDGSTSAWEQGTALTPGQLVRVTIQVTSADDLPGGVTLLDPLPAPFQAQDPNLPQPHASAVGAGLRPAPSVNSRRHRRLQPPPPPPYPPTPSPPRGGGGGYNPVGWYPNSPWMWGFPSQQVFKDAVQCFTPYFAAGSQTCSYVAEAVTSGHFRMPPAHARSMTQPGIMGLSSSHLFTVQPRASTSTHRLASLH